MDSALSTAQKMVLFWWALTRMMEESARAILTSSIKHVLPHEVLGSGHSRLPTQERARKPAADGFSIGADANYDMKPLIKKAARKSEINRRLNNPRVSTAATCFPAVKDPD